ncbi:MAG: radical SAM family heme chaperone HemW [Hyphomonas sp.]|uniref:radical SAM family heme chaperone HemW n=1 Tax=Hyphomonas sp. TaxID=87 RepID=UPI003528AEA1
MSQQIHPFGPHFGFGLYVHWPYCARICPYCDFNVYAAKDRDPELLLEAICADIRVHRERMPDHGALDSVYFGGGTPSLLTPAQIARILETANAVFGIKPGAEITLEANPNDVMRADLPGLAAAGIDRMSVGVQSLRDSSLAFLGRDHDAEGAKASVHRAMRAFRSVNVDMIYARPGQTPDDWKVELEDLLWLGMPHLSLYELTIKEGTPFGLAVDRGQIVPMPDDDQADLFELTQEILTQAGLPAYEVSNHALSPDHQSRHNLTYWNGGDWIGVGPGAHGRITVGGHRYASEAEKKPEAYMANVQALNTGWSGAQRLDHKEVARELLVMGLRPAAGINIERVESISGAAVPRDKIAAFAEQGWLRLDGTQLSLTPSGRLLADALTAQLAP